MTNRRHSASQHAVKDVGGGVSVCQRMCAFVYWCLRTARRPRMLTSTSASCYIIREGLVALISKVTECNNLLSDFITLFRACVETSRLPPVCVFVLSVLLVLKCLLICPRTGTTATAHCSKILTSKTCTSTLIDFFL